MWLFNKFSNNLFPFFNCYSQQHLLLFIPHPYPLQIQIVADFMYMWGTKAEYASLIFHLRYWKILEYFFPHSSGFFPYDYFIIVFLFIVVLNVCPLTHYQECVTLTVKLLLCCVSQHFERQQLFIYFSKISENISVSIQ